MKHDIKCAFFMIQKYAMQSTSAKKGSVFAYSVFKNYITCITKKYDNFSVNQRDNHLWPNKIYFLIVVSTFSMQSSYAKCGNI